MFYCYVKYISKQISVSLKKKKKLFFQVLLHPATLQLLENVIRNEECTFIFGVLRFRGPALIYLLNGSKWLNLAGLGYDVVEPFKSS